MRSSELDELNILLRKQLTHPSLTYVHPLVRACLRTAVFLSLTHRTKFYYVCDPSVREKAWRSRKRVA